MARKFDRSRAGLRKQFAGHAARVFWVVLLVGVPTPALTIGQVHRVAPRSLSPAQASPIFPSLPTPRSVPIQHIVFIMQENHAYDNFFVTYCTSAGTYCPTTGNGIPTGTCVPYNTSNPSAGCIRPYPFTNLTNSQTQDLLHTWNSSHEAYDDGKMDGWFVGENYKTRPMGYFDGTTIPSYWDWAEQYVLGDYFFSSYLSYSLSNHWAMVAGQAPPVSQQNIIGLELAQNSSNHTTQSPLKWFQAEYLNESNVTNDFADQVQEDLLQNGSAPSWKYYDLSLPTGPAGYDASIQDGETWDYWNPMAAKNETYLNRAINSHFVNRTDILDDAANGTLPNISWVLPRFEESDHPISDIYNGMGWVTTVLDALEASPEWNSTAVFVSWDEYGGYYDHVPPPQIDANGLGFRVPVLVISPYSREGYIDSQFGYFESVLHLMEWRFGLAPMTARVAEAPLPLRAFDFTQTPRAPLTLSADSNDTPYPQAFEAQAPPPTPLELEVASNGSGIILTWSLPPGGGSVDSYSVSYASDSCAAFTTWTVDGAAVGVSLSQFDGSGVFRIRANGPTASSAESSSTFGSPPTCTSTGGPGGWTELELLSLGAFIGLIVAVPLIFLLVGRRRKSSKSSS